MRIDPNTIIQRWQAIRDRAKHATFVGAVTCQLVEVTIRELQAKDEQIAALKERLQALDVKV